MLYNAAMRSGPMFILRLPKLLTIGWSQILFAKFSQVLEHHGPVTFDFGEVDWAAPFGLTALSVVIEKCQAQGKDVFFTSPRNELFSSYLNRIAFRPLFQKRDGIKPTKTSMELTRLIGVDPGCSENLVELISNNFPLTEDAKYEMRTHLNELMTNAFDHSKTKLGFFVCAQWYPVKRNLRISFADGGIGIFQSLKSSGAFPRVKNDLEAIRLAVKPGITTRKNQLGGFGMAYIRKYVRNNNGTLTIISGHGKVNFYRNKTENKFEPIKFDGTIVEILISPQKVSGLKEDDKHDLF